MHIYVLMLKHNDKYPVINWLQPLAAASRPISENITLYLSHAEIGFYKYHSKVGK